MKLAPPLPSERSLARGIVTANVAAVLNGVSTKHRTAVNCRSRIETEVNLSE